MSGKILPTIIIISIGAGIVYAIKGDIHHAAYWFSAAALNISVTY
jgi:5-enolpyruvylshikimate-3-phosphate synthase